MKVKSSLSWQWNYLYILLDFEPSDFIILLYTHYSLILYFIWISWNAWKVTFNSTIRTHLLWFLLHAY